METFPQEFEACVAAGHEIGVHGYSHENPIAMSREQESTALDYCVDLIESCTGRRPTGHVAPWTEFSPVTNELLLERGIKYDHSLMHRDFEPYYVRVGDSWTRIDYDAPAESWMKPLRRGRETDLIEILANWYLDDLPPMVFIKASPNSHGFVNPRDIETMWRDQFDWVYRESDYAVFAMTVHPDVSGRRPAMSTPTSSGLRTARTRASRTVSPMVCPPPRLVSSRRVRAPSRSVRGRNPLAPLRGSLFRHGPSSEPPTTSSSRPSSAPWPGVPTPTSPR
nr:polysaccharide deacetylase family protein [Streptomyces sp. NRRL F-5122]